MASSRLRLSICSMEDSNLRSFAPAVPVHPKTKRFWNWKLIGVELFVVAVGVAVGAYGFLAQAPRLPVMAGFAIGVLGIWLLSREFQGLAINAQVISFPSARLERLPIVALGRRLRSSPGSLQELTVAHPWFGFQIVYIRGDFGTEMLVFQSRDQRLRFMGVVEEICPNIRMFRRKQPRQNIST